MILDLAVVCFLCALVPALLFGRNLSLYGEPPPTWAALPAVSILIPARNEAAAIAGALEAALGTRGIPFEVVVMDDASTDGTAAIVQAFADADTRVRLERAPALPAGWNGKQHACWALAHAARNPVLCFVDADVRLSPDCVARMTQFLEDSNSSLVSGFPRQITETAFEQLLLPLIHFVLLGFLPLSRMRRSVDPAFAAGCGQLLVAGAADYFACGGHSGIRLTMHDGLRLPRLFREAGLRTDLADITSLASCRMYTSAHQVVQGLAKNATEGLADPRRIVPVTLLLLLGQVLPFAAAAYALFFLFIYLCASPLLRAGGVEFHMNQPTLFWYWLLWTLAAVLCAWFPRFAGVTRFRQNLRSAVLHPVGILLLLWIQWSALVRKLRGGKISWRDRTYTPEDIPLA